MSKYYDVFFNSLTAEIVEEPDPPVHGVLIDLPGPKQAVVYAVWDVLPMNPVAEGEPAPPIGVLHCLVTPEQYDQLEADNVPMIPTDALTNAFFNTHGGPGHVFNPIGIRYRENGKVKIHRIKSAEPEDEIDEIVEVVEE